MSTANISAILSAINTNARIACNKNRKQGVPVASFAKKDGKTVVNTGKSATERYTALGLSESVYVDYCNAMYSVYMDALHLARYASDKDKVNTIKTVYFNDLAVLVKSVMGETFKVNDVFVTFTVEQFIMQSVAVVREFSVSDSANGYDVVPVTLTKFVKWVEQWFSVNASGVAMLSLAERDRRNAMHATMNKIARLNKTIENATAVLDDAKKALDSAKAKNASETTIAKREKAITGAEKDLNDVKASLAKAEKRLAELKDQTTDYSADETV